MTDARSSGLDGVEVAATAISHVDGERGRLVIAGSDAEELAATSGYEAAAARVLSAGGLAITERELAAELGRARAAAWELLPRLGDALDAVDGMEALRAGIAHLRATGDDRADALAVMGAAPVLVAAWSRARRKQAPVPPSPSLDQATDYLAMTLGTPPTAAAARALGAYLIAVIDHGMNASTFTARVVASTASDLVSSVVAAIGALKGPLHGGAPGPVLDMLDAIGAPDRADAWVEAELGSGRRIMGMGHRVYRVRDPRAAVLESAVLALRAGGKNTPRLELARAVESVATGMLAKKYPARSLQANVEFYTAVLLDALGLDRRQFTPTFAVGRVAGWCAHVAEQRARGRLIRPQSVYVGRVPTLEQQHR